MQQQAQQLQVEVWIEDLRLEKYLANFKYYVISHFLKLLESYIRMVQNIKYRYVLNWKQIIQIFIPQLK